MKAKLAKIVENGKTLYKIQVRRFFIWSDYKENGQTLKIDNLMSANVFLHVEFLNKSMFKANSIKMVSGR